MNFSKPNPLVLSLLLYSKIRFHLNGCLVVFDSKKQRGMEPICPVCSNASVHQCLQCMKVSYCSIEHKNDHWNEHKLFCYPVKIVVNDDASKNLEATRDIQKGEHIFIEKPLLTGPKVTDYQNKFPLCLECYKIVRGNYRCTGCKWPLCGRACEMVNAHVTISFLLLKLLNIHLPGKKTFNI